MPETYELSSHEETRVRRKVDINSSSDANIAVQKHSDENTEEPTKVPLRSLITAVESDLVTKALQINAHLRRRRRELPSDGINVKLNDTNDKIDENTNLFQGLFNFTRPQRETTENKDVKIPLNGIVKAVESTFVNSAQTLKEPTATNHENGTLIKTTSDSNNSTRVNRDTEQIAQQNGTEPKKEQEIVQVQKLDSNNLDLLKPITFKPPSEEPTTDSTTVSHEESIATTIKNTVVHKTDLTLVHTTNTFSLIPRNKNNITHVQHQQISKSVFHSNLAIFPTISSHSINTPLPPNTTTEESVPETTDATRIKDELSKSEKEEKFDKLQQNAERLKEKFAEVQAQPVILSTI